MGYFTGYVVTSICVSNHATLPFIQWLLYSCLISSIRLLASQGPGRQDPLWIHLLNREHEPLEYMNARGSSSHVQTPCFTDRDTKAQRVAEDSTGRWWQKCHKDSYLWFWIALESSPFTPSHALHLLIIWGLTCCHREPSTFLLSNPGMVAGGRWLGSWCRA